MRPEKCNLLNRRALGVAGRLDHWVVWLCDKAKEQDVNLIDPLSAGKLSLKLNDVMSLIADLQNQRKGLLQYTEPPKRSTRRSPRGFSP
jgi:hypothetical protein